MHLQLAAHFSPCAQVRKEILRARPNTQRDRVSFVLEAGHDDQAAANSHDIFKRGDHQVGNVEGLHQSGPDLVTTKRADKRAHNA